MEYPIRLLLRMPTMDKLSREEERLLDLLAGGACEAEIARVLALPTQDQRRVWNSVCEKLKDGNPLSVEDAQMLLKFERAQQRRGERTAAADEARLRALVDHSPVATLVVDIRSGRILRGNRACQMLFGYGAGELLGLPVEALVDPDMRMLHEAYRVGYAKDAKDQRTDAHPSCFGRIKNGASIALDIVLSPIPETGEVVVFCGRRTN